MMALFRSSCGVYLQSRRVCSRARRLLGGGSDAGTGMRIWKQAIVSLVLLVGGGDGLGALLPRGGGAPGAGGDRHGLGRAGAGGAERRRPRSRRRRRWSSARAVTEATDQRLRLGDRRRAGGAVGVGDALRRRPGGGDRGGLGRLRARGGAAGAARCRERGDRARPGAADARGRRGDARARPGRWCARRR